jgi:hypothetical protein
MSSDMDGRYDGARLTHAAGDHADWADAQLTCD